MNKFKEKFWLNYKSVIKFITNDIWRLDFSELSNFKARLIRHLKVLIITLKEFGKLRVGREAVALSYFGIMAAVPLVAVILAVSNGFGLNQKLSDMLYSSFPTSTDLIAAILGFANNIVVSIDKGAFGWISFITFVWLVIWLMLNIEGAFNRIWKVEKSRSLWKRGLVYLTILILSPFVLLLFLYGVAYYAQFINEIKDNLGFFSFITTNLYWIIFYGVTIFVLSAMYFVIPHAKIKYSACLKASMISGFAFVVIQYLYLETQLMVTRLSAVYGIFAAIPLLMAWMNLCWFVILFGSDLSYAFQHVDDYNAEIDK
jgi:membrane protein